MFSLEWIPTHNFIRGLRNSYWWHERSIGQRNAILTYQIHSFDKHSQQTQNHPSCLYQASLWSAEKEHSGCRRSLLPSLADTYNHSSIPPPKKQKTFCLSKDITCQRKKLPKFRIGVGFFLSFQENKYIQLRNIKTTVHLRHLEKYESCKENATSKRVNWSNRILHLQQDRSS